MNKKYLIGGVIIIGFIVFAGLTLKKSLTPYVSFSEARRTGSTVQVKGERVDGTEHFDIGHETFNFKMKDPSGEVFEVVYRGVKPSNFEQASEIVAIGRFSNGKFEAEQLLVKCPSKYQAEGIQT
jgi:cytochrome c-type biogenesis protein CcmE